MKTITKNMKIGRNRGMARIWIENSTLAQYGFERGATISVDIEPNLIRIYADQYGLREVAGRVRNGKAISIIDINNPELTTMVGDATTARITYDGNGGAILIEVIR